MFQMYIGDHPSYKFKTLHFEYKFCNYETLECGSSTNAFKKNRALRTVAHIQSSKKTSEDNQNIAEEQHFLKQTVRSPKYITKDAHLQPGAILNNFTAFGSQKMFGLASSKLQLASSDPSKQSQ